MVVINWLFWPRHARRQVSSAQFFAMLSRPSHESASRGYAANARWSIPDATRRWSRKCAEKTSRAQLDRPVRALARLDPREARAWQKFYFLLGSQDVHDAAAPRPQAWTTQCSELRLHQSWPNNCRAKPPQLPNKKTADGAPAYTYVSLARDNDRCEKKNAIVATSKTRSNARCAEKLQFLLA